MEELTQLIVFGLFFSTILTLIVTPVMLAVPEKLRYMFKLHVQPLVDEHVMPPIKPLLDQLKAFKSS